MARHPEPWYMARRKAWFVQIDKQQIKLGDDPSPQVKGGKAVPPPLVKREYHRVMATKGRTEPGDRRRATVPEVCELFLAAKSAVRDSTAVKYAWFSKRFASPLMGREFRSVRKEDIVAAAEAQKRWSPGTKHDFVIAVAIIFNWARDAGYLDFNPLAGWDNPYPKAVRTRGMTDAEFTALMDEARDVQFKQVMMFLRGTGCRPGEMCAVEAKHVHPDKPLVMLPPELHKTGRRTGKTRVLVMPKDLEVMVRALALRRPKGPLLRNSRNDGRWTTGAISRRVRSYRIRLGLADDVVPYLIRHATLTRLVEVGTSVMMVAKMAGHASPNTLGSVYYHADVDLMTAAADRAHERKKKG